MAIYSDVTYFLAYIVGLVGTIVSSIGATISGGVTTPGAMYALTQGIFGANGGLIYFINEKILWLMDNILGSLTFTYITP